jgi:hypothetical protein
MEKGGNKNIIQQRNKKQGTSSNLSETMSFSKRGKRVDFDLTRKINTPFSWKSSLPLFESKNRG